MGDRNTIDMTEGRPLPVIIRFSVPLILSAFFQQLYSFVDSVIVGRLIGVDALAAVNLTAPLTYLFLGLTIGSTLGFCVPLAQAVGAGDREDMSRYFWNGGALCLALSLLPIAAVPCAEPLLRLISTPDEYMPMSASYLRVILLGQFTAIAYNYGAGVLRAFGDSKHPFRFLLIASSVNVALDILFISAFHMGVAGAAVATVISQSISAALCFRHLFVRTGRIERRDGSGNDFARLSPGHLRTLCVIGLPMGLELSVNSIGTAILQSCVNRMGAATVAAVAAGEKIRSMLTLPLENLGTAASTYTAQNLGAKKPDRIRQGIRSCVIIIIFYCAFAWVLVFALKGSLVHLLLGNDAPDVTEMAVRYLSVISCLFFFHGILQLFRSVLQGMGHSGVAVASGFMEIAGRIVGGNSAVHFASFLIISLSNPMAWILAGSYCVVMTIIMLRKHR